MMPQDTDPITKAIIGAAIEVHRAFGPGLLESAYDECLYHELQLRQIWVERQVPLLLKYKGIALDCSYRIDLLVEKEVVVELKTVETFLPIHDAQVLTYLRLGGWRRGLLLNFNVDYLRYGIRRLANNY